MVLGMPAFHIGNIPELLPLLTSDVIIKMILLYPERENSRT